MTFNGNRGKGVAVLLYLANRAKAPHGWVGWNSLLTKGL